MKLIPFFIAILCSAVTFSGCHKTNSRQENSTTGNDTIDNTFIDEDTILPTYTVKYIDDVSLEEFDTIYAECFVGNAAGYEFTFEQYIAQKPQTMHFSFPVMQSAEENPLHIVDAPDGKIRFYGWNSDFGGSCIYWSNMYQVKDNDSVYTFDGLPDWDCESMLPTHIYKLPHKTRNYYLISFYYRISGSEAYIAAYTYELYGKELKRVYLFKDGETLSDRVEYEYRISDRSENAVNHSNRPYFDEQKARLYFPNSPTQHDHYQWNNELLIKRSE